MRTQLQPNSQRQVYIGLGSNLGDRLAHLTFAKHHFSIVAESPIYESPAMLPEGAGAEWNRPFLNQVVEIETSLAPLELLAEVKRVEREAGRRNRGRWAPRELDLDIISYGDVKLDAPELTLPHAGIAQRDFVLLPLKDIAPHYPNIDAMITQLPDVVAKPWHKRTQIMGILNITPDSFSDGGAMDVASILARFEQLVNDGAGIIDIGAESTRPNATPLTPDQEWQRLEAPLSAIMAHALRTRVKISIDTRHALTAKSSLALGVDWINDVSGLSDAAMLDVLRDSLCDVVVMHSLTVPADRNVTLPENADPIAEVLKWKQKMLAQGISADRLIFDPGVGFGKTPAQSLALIERANELVASGGRWLIGHSRKSFMQVPLDARDALTVSYSQQLMAAGVDVLRVHDVKGHENLLARTIEDAPGLAGIELGLTRLQGLLADLGHPELKMPPVIHIAGTNGKGSTLAYLRAIYEAAGKRVHAYTSPHLVRFNERIILANQEISDAQFMDAILRVKALESKHLISVFERITAAAYLCFSEVEADIVLLETGLGGRLDATNIPPKIAAVLTPIAMDHAEYLGDTVAKVAAEKAAIMRAGIPCFHAPQSDEAMGVITAAATRIGAPLHPATLNDNISPALEGAHQRMNAALAATVAQSLGIDDAAIIEGIKRAQWPARLQKLRYGPLVKAWGKRGNVMLDGGHNPHAAEALVQWMAAQDRPVILVCGMMARKSADAWMRAMAPHVAEVICIPMRDEGAYTTDVLTKMATKAGIAKVSAAESMDLLRERLASYPVSPAHILVAGSLYLAGSILKTHG